MDPKTEQLLRELASKLGTTVEHLWSVLILQARIEAIAGSFLILLLLGLGALCGMAFFRNKREWDNHNEDAKLAATAIGGFAGLLIGGIVLIADLSRIVAGFLNPEYLALREVARLF